MEYINEESSADVFINTFDNDGNPITATTLTYRVDDLKSGTEIIPKTTVVPDSSTYHIPLTSTNNKVVNSVGADEVHVVTYKFTYPVDKEGTGRLRFKIDSLGFISKID